MSEKDRDSQAGGASEGEGAPEKESPAGDSPASGSEESSTAAESSAEAASPSEEDEAAKKAEAAAKAKAAAEAKKKAEEARLAAEAAKPPWERDPDVPEWQDADDDEIAEALRAKLPDAIVSARAFAGQLTLVATREGVLDVARSLKEDHGCTYMVDVAGADYPDREERFEVVYHVYNHETDTRVRLKVSTDENTPVPSLTSVWRGTNWPEREAYDMYGIRFHGHPDLTRILLWEGFNGYPLRKDFPVEGIDTGSAIYPEYYEEAQGPISGDGTGWKVPEPPAPPAEEDAAGEATEGDG